MPPLLCRCMPRRPLAEKMRQVSVLLLLLEGVPGRGLTFVRLSAQRKHLLWAASLHTSTLQFAVSTVCGRGCVFK